MERSLTELPPEILSDILSRLPITRLLTCKAVCKTFLETTSSNPYFNSLLSSKMALYLIVQFGNSNHPTGSVHLIDSGLDTAFLSTEMAELKPMFHIPDYPGRYHKSYNMHAGDQNNFCLVNSCDGLLYFAERDCCERSFVCNPVMEDYLTLPEVVKDRNLFQLTMGSWFGFSVGDNRYKVLRILTTVIGRPREFGFKQVFSAQVLVVGSSSWRDIGEQPPSEHLTWDTCFILLDGSVYWLCQFPELSKFIVYFDFHQEKFGEIPSPPELRNGWRINRHYASMGVLGGCLSLAVNVQSLDIWVLQRYDSQVSWTRQFVIDTSFPVGNLLVEGTFKPLQVLDNRYVILMIWSALAMVCYDSKERTFKIFNLNGVGSVCRSALLKPSLVPLMDALNIDDGDEQNFE
ncbi:hypothetical protein SASPL_109863 [Salvia splendens]|uniref:F-box domain-containing protein n=1 Tax=Salvia splendens TaxID=180675 RepID=A0A8X8YKT1_SALSN|nr:F-box protein At3g07870-like [Salvia splendens]XP_042051129.1 F-box protein At3g07870-like [Salvia splendens]KAG6431780.1 hypothetical protein SASPL_109863 [Salvia splendens]